MDPLYNALQPAGMRYEEAITRINLMNDPDLKDTPELAEMKRKFQEDVIEKRYARDGYYSNKIGKPMAYQLAAQNKIDLPKVDWRAEADERGDAYVIW